MQRSSASSTDRRFVVKNRTRSRRSCVWKKCVNTCCSARSGSGAGRDRPSVIPGSLSTAKAPKTPRGCGADPEGRAATMPSGLARAPGIGHGLVSGHSPPDGNSAAALAPSTRPGALPRPSGDAGTGPFARSWSISSQTVWRIPTGCWTPGMCEGCFFSEKEIPLALPKENQIWFLSEGGAGETLSFSKERVSPAHHHHLRVPRPAEGTRQRRPVS